MRMSERKGKKFTIMRACASATMLRHSNFYGFVLQVKDPADSFLQLGISSSQLILPQVYYEPEFILTERQRIVIYSVLASKTILALVIVR